MIIVGDIDRGGVFAALYGTVGLLEPSDQRLIAGFVINKFRGARELPAPGLAQISALTGRPVYGVLPWLGGLWLDVEDSLALDSAHAAARPHLGTGQGRRNHLDTGALGGLIESGAPADLPIVPPAGP